MKIGSRGTANGTEILSDQYLPFSFPLLPVLMFYLLSALERQVFEFINA